jgi:deoxyribonuclease V
MRLPSAYHSFIITTVEIHPYQWPTTTSGALSIQKQLSSSVSRNNCIINPKYIAGVDMSAPDSSGYARAAVVLLNYPQLDLIECQTFREKPALPYIPGLLSFRECPIVIKACEKLSISPQLIIVDGQGIAHPRRFGIASHLGVLLDIPTIGCAKSRLCGTYQPPQEPSGCYSSLIDHDEKVGVALRTRKGTKPLFISIGHKVDLQSAVRWILNTCKGYRLPEPSRLAHLAASGKL